MTPQTKAEFREWPIAIGAILFVLGVLIIGIAKKTGLLDYETSARAANTAMGLMLMVAGNYFPKIARPLSDQLEASARALAADRLAGRILMLAGLVYALLWIFAPFDLDWVKFTGSAMVLLTFAGVGAHQAWIAHGDIVPFQQARPNSPGEWKRGSLFVILHALMWAFAMILVDFIWGDDSAIWMIALFVVTNGLITSLVIARHTQAQ